AGTGGAPDPRAASDGVHRRSGRRRHRARYPVGGEPRVKLERYLLPAAAGLYVLAELLASSLPGLSRLAHLGLALMLVALLIRVARGSLTLRPEPLLVIFTLFFLLAFASILWSGDGPAGLVRSISVLTAILGAMTIWISLWNGLSLKW